MVMNRRGSSNSVNEDETLAQRRKRKATGSRGDYAQNHLQQALFKLKQADAAFDYDRLLDSKAAGRIVAAQVADFLVFYGGNSAAVEVKEIKSGFRLPKKSFPQFPRIKRRMRAGAFGFLVVYTVESSCWFLLDVGTLEEATSWKLDEHPSADRLETAGSVLGQIIQKMR